MDTIVTAILLGFLIFLLDYARNTETSLTRMFILWGISTVLAFMAGIAVEGTYANSLFVYCYLLLLFTEMLLTGIATIRDMWQVLRS